MEGTIKVTYRIELTDKVELSAADELLSRFTEIILTLVKIIVCGNDLPDEGKPFEIFVSNAMTYSVNIVMLKTLD